MNQEHDILNFAIDAGKAMLRFGGEIYRVQDTIEIILESFGFPNHEVYVLSNGIFVSITQEDQETCSAVRNIPLESMNLSGIAALNQLTRDIQAKKISFEEAKESLQNILQAKKRGPYALSLACAIGSAAFCYLYGGSWLDSLIAFFNGFLLQSYLNMAERKNISKFMSQIFGSVIVTTVSLIALHMGLPVHQAIIVIGSIMRLVPGVPLTTSIRDIFAGDYLSGTIHLMDALFTAFSIAIGVGSVITIYRVLLGGALLP